MKPLRLLLAVCLMNIVLGQIAYAQTVKHRFTNPTADNGDPNETGPSEWNDSHVVAGGSNGQCFVRDTTAPDGWSWQSCSGSSGAPVGAQYWTGAADSTLTAEKNLGALGTALVINTSGTPSAYTAQACSNQCVTGMSAVGVPTCSSVTDLFFTSALGITHGGTGQNNSTAAFNALDPLTTKGDTLGNDGTNSVRIPVGSNNQCFIADSAQTAGVKWGSCASGGSGNVTNTGASVVSQIPRYTDTSGTAIAPSTATVDASGNAVVQGTVTVGGTGPGIVDLPTGFCTVVGPGTARICADSTDARIKLSENGGSLRNIASGDASGNALTGDSATGFWTTGTVDTARLGSGSASSTTFLRGDQTWAAPGGSSSYNPADLTKVSINEEFCEFVNSLSAGFFKTVDLVGSGTVGAAAGALPNPCVWTVATSSASGDTTLVALLDSGLNGYITLGDHSTGVPWEAQWVFAIGSTASITARVGLMNATSGLPNDGLWLRFDTSASDTNFQFECRKASTSSITDTTIAGDTNFHRVRIWSTVAGQINFELYSNNGTLQKQSLNICSTNDPTADLTAGALVKTNTTATKSIKVDAFGYSRTVAR